ncbi:MAG: MmcQ/YjbR family DNA-binding protein [Gammaproteobacteria bacterium]|nr:MmcQ/YjbR family DNA-binding protein [Gammaproteobacteria bacterium]
MFDAPPDHFEWLVDLCHKAEGVEHDLMWGDELVFRFGEAMFCLFRLENKRTVAVTFRPPPEEREKLLAHPAVEKASFPAVGEWIKVQEEVLASPSHPHFISREQLSHWVRRSYEMARQEAA